MTTRAGVTGQTGRVQSTEKVHHLFFVVVPETCFFYFVHCTAS